MKKLSAHAPFLAMLIVSQSFLSCKISVDILSRKHLPGYYLNIASNTEKIKQPLGNHSVEIEKMESISTLLVNSYKEKKMAVLNGSEEFIASIKQPFRISKPKVKHSLGLTNENNNKVDMSVPENKSSEKKKSFKKITDASFGVVLSIIGISIMVIALAIFLAGPLEYAALYSSIAILGGLIYGIAYFFK